MKTKEVLLLTLCFILSCKSVKQKDFIQVDLTDAFILNSPEVIYSFTDKYPTDMYVRDSIAYIIQIKSDTCLMALNLNSKQIIQSFGTSGHGPNDIISPTFILSVDHMDVLLEDGFAGKFNVIDVNEQTNKFVVKKYMDYSDKIFHSGETNISGNFIAGRELGKSGKMFYIYDRNTDVVKEMDFYPEIKNLNPSLDLNYVYAPSIALNEERNRVLVGMYFFDMFHVYDLSGNRIDTYCLSGNCVPSFSRNASSLVDIIESSNTGLVRSFPTKDYCYFLRVKRNNSADNMLVKLDWDGNLINAYNITDEIGGQFYIDEKGEKMYVIRHSLLSDIEEVFEVVSYLL